MNFFEEDKKFTEENANFAEKILSKVYPGSTILDLEGFHRCNTPPVIAALDKVGIDKVICWDGIAQGVSCRNYRKPREKKTVTVRLSRHGTPAEFFYLKKALQSGGLAARLNVQCYISEDYESAMGILIKNEDLIRYIERHGANIFGDGGNVEFYSVSWRALFNFNVPFKIFYVDDSTVQEISAENFFNKKSPKLTL